MLVVSSNEPEARFQTRPPHSFTLMAISRFTELFDPADHPFSRSACSVSLAAVLEETALRSRRGSEDSGASGDEKERGAGSGRAASAGGKLRKMSIQRRVRTG